MDTLDEEEIDEVLRDTGYGYLGLARDNQPYVIPMAFGYHGEAIYFQMDSQGRKFEYMESNPVASFAVLGINETSGISKSVLVEGEVTPVSGDDEEDAYEALAANAAFGTDLEVWGNPVQDVELTLLTLNPTSVTGRVFGREMA